MPKHNKMSIPVQDRIMFRNMNITTLTDSNSNKMLHKRPMPQTKEQFRTASLDHTAANVLECMTEEDEEEQEEEPTPSSRGQRFTWLKQNTHYPGGSLSSGKQYSQVIQDRQDEAGTGPGTPKPDGGLHRPMADMYFVVRVARGAGNKSATSAPPPPSVVEVAGPGRQTDD